MLHEDPMQVLEMRLQGVENAMFYLLPFPFLFYSCGGELLLVILEARNQVGNELNNALYSPISGVISNFICCRHFFLFSFEGKLRPTAYGLYT